MTDERSFLLETPPYCPTAACFVHGMTYRYAEHHVPGCPMSKTFNASMHEFEHGMRDLGAAMAKALLPVVELGRTLWASLPWYERLRVRIEAWFNR